MRNTGIDAQEQINAQQHQEIKKLIVSLNRQNALLKKVSAQIVSDRPDQLRFSGLTADSYR
jgi:fructose-1-phosphate kinase PfkB-like protein